MNSQFLTLFSVCLICHIFRSTYEVLKYKKKISPGNKIVFGFMFINMGALWASWFMMCESDPVYLALPAWLKFSGLIVFIAGILLFILTLIQMKTLDNYSGDLIQTGLFSITRHPMYLGFIFWIIGYPLFQQAQTALITSMIWILNILFWRKIEEKELERKYNNYIEYKKETLF